MTKKVFLEAKQVVFAAGRGLSGRDERFVGSAYGNLRSSDARLCQTRARSRRYNTMRKPQEKQG